jgi:hypothetical protein
LLVAPQACCDELAGLAAAMAADPPSGHGQYELLEGAAGASACPAAVFQHRWAPFANDWALMLELVGAQQAAGQQGVSAAPALSDFTASGAEVMAAGGINNLGLSLGSGSPALHLVQQLAALLAQHGMRDGAGCWALLMKALRRSGSMACLLARQLAGPASNLPC